MTAEEFNYLVQGIEKPTVIELNLPDPNTTLARRVRVGKLLENEIAKEVTLYTEAEQYEAVSGDIISAFGSTREVILRATTTTPIRLSDNKFLTEEDADWESIVWEDDKVNGNVINANGIVNEYSFIRLALKNKWATPDELKQAAVLRRRDSGDYDLKNILK